MTWQGTLLHIHIASAASYEMEELAEAQLVAGRGIVRDRYYLGTGTYSLKPDIREITLIEAEVLEAIAKGEPKIPGFIGALAPEDHRRNLPTCRRSARPFGWQALPGRGNGFAGGTDEFPVQVPRGASQHARPLRGTAKPLR